VLAIGITVGLLVMLTLLPALLVTVGRWVFWPVRPRYGSAEPSTSGVWARMGAGVARHPRRIWIGTTLVLGSMAVGAVQLNATGLSLEDAFRTRPDSVVGAGVLARHFPAAAGSGSPVVVVSDAAQVHEVRSAFAGTQGIVASSVTEPRVRSGQAYLEGTLVSAADSRAAYDTVDRARASVQAVPGAHAMVGGTSAITHDVQDSSGRDSKRIIPIVLVIVFVILALLLRALTAPVILLATVMLSFGAALGVSALVFRHLFHFHGADPSMPLYVFVYLVALGIDYNIFLMTRVREEAQHQDTRVAARVGLAATGGVITSAGLVLAGTFSVLATLPLTTFTEIGFAVAFGVLLDTVVVRSILVTALNLDIGDRIWWPSRLPHR
jgi:RND superfamily putative drug exporter